MGDAPARSRRRAKDVAANVTARLNVQRQAPGSRDAVRGRVAIAADQRIVRRDERSGIDAVIERCLAHGAIDQRSDIDLQAGAKALLERSWRPYRRGVV